MAKTYFKFLTSRNSPSNHGNYIPLEVKADPEICSTLFILQPHTCRGQIWLHLS